MSLQSNRAKQDARPTILVVDDDPEIARLLVRYLESQGLSVSTAPTLKAMRAALSAHPDLMVLDVMLPDGNGLDACREIRAAGDNTPIILLTALQEEVDRIVGLEMGADDYLPKPFNPRELLARIRAVLRRAAPAAPDRARRLSCSSVEIDRDARVAYRKDGTEIELTAAEFDLLRCLAERSGRVLSRETLLDLTKGHHVADAYDRSVDVQISRLRRKLGCDGLIKTIRNGGYKFCEPVEVVQ